MRVQEKLYGRSLILCRSIRKYLHFAPVDSRRGNGGENGGIEMVMVGRLQPQNPGTAENSPSIHSSR